MAAKSANSYARIEPDVKEQADLEENILKLDHMPLRFREYETEPWRSRGMLTEDGIVFQYVITHNSYPFIKSLGLSSFER